MDLGQCIGTSLQGAEESTEWHAFGLGARLSPNVSSELDSTTSRRETSQM